MTRTGSSRPGRRWASCCGSWGCADADLPPAGEQAGRYQSELAHLADAGKPVLLVADNASTAAQVEALIPARSEHRLLVTSRDILASIPARLIDLDVLPPSAAADLIAQVLTSARPGDRRVRDEAAALQQVAELCGRLPLALQITAEILKADPGLPVAAMAAELQDPPARLAALSREDGGGRTRAVRAAFEASYRRLAAEQARLFRLLALNPGPDTATEAAAALAGAPAGQVRPLLAALAGASLVTEQPVGGNRWRMHDLIRLYAAELGRDAARDDQSEAALDRLLEHYRDTAAAADDHLRALPGQAVPERFDGRADALAWLDAERPTLVAAVTLAAASGRARTAVSLASCLAVFLDWRRHFDDMITTGQAAVDSAHHAGDLHGEAAALTNLGVALREVRRFDEAITAHQQAAALFAELGDRHGEAAALNNLGVALQEVRRFDEAITAHQRAAALFTELGDRHGEAMALDNLGRRPAGGAAVRRGHHRPPAGRRPLPGARRPARRSRGAEQPRQCPAGGAAVRRGHHRPPAGRRPLHRARRPARRSHGAEQPRQRPAGGAAVRRGHHRPPAGPCHLPRARRPAPRSHGAEQPRQSPCSRCGGSTRPSPPTSRPLPSSPSSATGTAKPWRWTTSAVPCRGCGGSMRPSPPTSGPLPSSPSSATGTAKPRRWTTSAVPCGRCGGSTRPSPPTSGRRPLHRARRPARRSRGAGPTSAVPCGRCGGSMRPSPPTSGPLALFTELGDRHREGMALRNLVASPGLVV